MRKAKQVADSTSNSRVHKQALRFQREHNGELKCSLCPYHGGCNDHGHDFSRSWKRHRRTQYKVV